jgi:hypothetical protein
MCFSAEASLGAAVALLPAGAYCVETAWRKNRAYLPLALAPVLFGLQQLCEMGVWVGLGRGSEEVTRRASLAFLLFALVVWPVWVPLAAAAVEPRGWKRRAFVALAAGGVLFGLAYYLPLAADRGHGLSPAVVGHSIRYDFSVVPVTRSAEWWVWPLLYAAAVVLPLLTSRDRHLRPLGVAVAAGAAGAYLLFEHAFASVWCFFAAILALYLSYVLYRLRALPEPDLRPSLSN